MTTLVSRDRWALCTVLLVGLAFIVLNEWFQSSRQTITVRVANGDSPVPNLLLDLKVDGRHDCSARTGFYRSGLTDAEGVESWSRPIRRERTGYRSGNRKLFEKKFGLLPPKLEDVQICANTGNGKELIYFGEVEKLERRLNVTCDLALKTTEKCFGTSPISLDRTLLPYVFFPFWILLAVAIARAGGRPVEADIALAFGLLVLGVLTGPLGRFWLLCQVLAVAATLGVTFALAYTLSANHQFRRSNQG